MPPHCGSSRCRSTQRERILIGHRASRRSETLSGHRHSSRKVLQDPALSTAAPLHPTSSLASHQLLHPVHFNIDYIYRIGHRQPPLDFSFDKGAQLRGSQFATSRPCQQLSLASPASSRARLSGSIGMAIRYGAWPGANRGVAPARGWRQQPKSEAARPKTRQQAHSRNIQH